MATPAPHMVNGAQSALSHLRDIHTPAPVGAWPPAPGWFLLAGLVLAAVVALAWWLVRRWQTNRYRREAMEELESLRNQYQREADAAQYLAAYSALLKRIALTRYPRGQVAHLTGEAWVDFLDKAGDTDEFSMGAGQVLVDANYRPVQADIDVDALHDLAKHWIRRHRRKAMEKAA